MKVYATHHASIMSLIEIVMGIEHKFGDKAAHRFLNAFLGALSAEVDPTIWAQCLAFTKEGFDQEQREREKHDKPQ